VRSFALVHEALGDLLQFPTGLTEKAGLALATALRDGRQTQLRAALAEADVQDAKSEWALLQKTLKDASTAPRDRSRGGRPQEITRLPSRDLPKGGALSAEVSSDGLRIELKGRVINADTAEQILKLIARQIG
jgi:ParB family chromosome partitioning protein